MEYGPHRGAGGGFRQLLATMSINMMASVVTALVALGATAFMARYLPIDEFGRILLLLTVVNAFAIFEGQRPVVIHRVATITDGHPALFRAAAKVNALMVGVTLLFLAAGLIGGAAKGLPVSAGVALAATVFFFFMAMQYWTFLDAEQDTAFTGMSRSICWILLYLSFAILAYFDLGIPYYTLSLLAMHVLLAGILFARFHLSGFRSKYDAREGTDEVDGLMRPALNNIIFNTCAVTINVADRAIVGSILGIRSAGLYAGPSELALRATGLVRAGVQVVLPWAARVPGKLQQRYWLATVAFLLIAVGTGISLLFFTRDFVAPFLLGHAFRNSGDLLAIFSLGVLFSTLGYACIVQFNAHGDFSTQRRLYMVAAVLLVGGAAWGAFEGKLLYVALAYVLARSVDLILMAILLRRCDAASRRAFITIAAAMSIALAASWERHIYVAMTALGIAYTLGYVFWLNKLKHAV